MKEWIYSYGNSTSVSFDFDIKGDSNVFILSWEHDPSIAIIKGPSFVSHTLYPTQTHILIPIFGHVLNSFRKCGQRFGENWRKGRNKKALCHQTFHHQALKGLIQGPFWIMYWNNWVSIKLHVRVTTDLVLKQQRGFSTHPHTLIGLVGVGLRGIVSWRQAESCCQHAAQSQSANWAYCCLFSQ